MQQETFLESPEESAPKSRKSPVRSEYLFPAYALGTALVIAERVERDGAGSLTEQTLAMAMSMSVKGSTFKLRHLTARQFGLLSRQGDTLSTTPRSKAIFKSTSPEEGNRARLEAFLDIPLFKVVAERYRGTPLPESNTFRNILERDFKVAHGRVTDAERVLLDSARDAGLITTAGSNTYLNIEGGAVPTEVHIPLAPPPAPPIDPPIDPPPAGELTIEQMRMEYVRKLGNL